MRPLAKAITLSLNKKLGHAATTHAGQASCPSDCAFLGEGCYAERGPLGMFVLRKLNGAAEEQRATALDVAHAEAEAIDMMRVIRGLPMRLHTVGDCASDEAARIVSAAAERYMDRGGGQVWTYTHAWRNVSRRSWGEVSVLASCETPADVTLARRRGYATSLVVEKFRGRRRYRERRQTILPCPAQTTNDEITCSECRLCFNDKRLLEQRISIGFEVHGDRVTQEKALGALRSRNQPKGE